MTVKDAKSNSKSDSPLNPYNQGLVTFDRHGEVDQKKDKLPNTVS